jgi:alpha-L-rhamnosidase
MDDDNIALKGTKGPLADQDKDSPAVEHVLITGCTFGTGFGVLTLGSEACHVRDVVVENCKVIKESYNTLLRLKLRPDTPQHYEDIHVRDITMNCGGQMVSIEPWAQYFDLKGQPAPSQLVENISITRITGATGSFGKIAGPPKSVLRNITLEDIDITLKKTEVTIQNVEELKVHNVKINGVPYEPKQYSVILSVKTTISHTYENPPFLFPFIGSDFHAHRNRSAARRGGSTREAATSGRR